MRGFTSVALAAFAMTAFSAPLENEVRQDDLLEVRQAEPIMARSNFAVVDFGKRFVERRQAATPTKPGTAGATGGAKKSGKASAGSAAPTGAP